MKIREKRMLSALCVMTMGISLLVGCSTTKKTTTEVSTAQDSKVKLSFTFRDDGLGEKGNLYKWLKQITPEFTKKTNIEVAVNPITASEGDYFAKIALALKSPDTAPDIITEDTFQINGDVAAGYLTPIDDYLKKWTDWTDNSYYEALKKGVTASDSKVYGVPYNTDSRGLWYNKDLFEKAGLPREWQPKTWDEVIATCKTLKVKLPDVIPFWMNSGKATGEATSMQSYEMLLYGTGERLIDDNNKWIVKSQGILDSLSFIQTIYTQGLGAPISKVLDAQAGNMSARDYMPKGKLAISLDGSWITGNWSKGGAAEWSGYENIMGFAKMPTNKGQGSGSVTLAGGWALSIPKNSKNHDAAWKFIEYAMSKDNALAMSTISGEISCRQDVAADPTYQKTPFKKLSTEYLEAAEFRPANESYPLVSTEIQNMVESVVTGTKPEAAMKTYGENVTRVVGDTNIIEK
ncbi:extracellular solute-binding protein [Clostridium lacusfryxellense]|uniref:extracellular solute-binding protein n=1 Tax=Clostridium lacusfryxellense TaxID=205328 RepID=UPI001C0C6D54|nr:extracellular solute-binding protein [Clostridium lacusfryxellense]MBU3113834.1 extracellular solute-binding protein [Clostridium lacusfryxellense]